MRNSKARSATRCDGKRARIYIHRERERDLSLSLAQDGRATSSEQHVSTPSLLSTWEGLPHAAPWPCTRQAQLRESVAAWEEKRGRPRPRRQPSWARAGRRHVEARRTPREARNGAGRRGSRAPAADPAARKPEQQPWDSRPGKPSTDPRGPGQAGGPSPHSKKGQHHSANSAGQRARGPNQAPRELSDH